MRPENDELSAELQDFRGDLSYAPFVCLFGIGVLIRAVLMFVYYPAVMMNFDSPRFARIDSMPIFGDYWMPAGYPVFLKGVRAISDELWFTIAVQHLLGLCIGLVLFVTARRFGLKRSISATISAVPLLSGDHLYLEHLVTADNFLIFLSAVGLAAAVRGLVPQVSVGWLATASTVLATAALARNVGVVLLPVLVLCTIFWVGGPVRHRATVVTTALFPGVGVFGIYWGACWLTHGQYLGLVDMVGWNLYSRVAPFADCAKFDPPAGTKILCEQQAPAGRSGPYAYIWDAESVSRKNFELGPKTGAQLRKFAKKAILHQPLDYCRAVGVDLFRYLSDSFYRRDWAGETAQNISFGWRDLRVERVVVEAMSRGYRDTKVHLRGQRFLAGYQSVFCVRGTLILALAVFTVIGIAKARGSLRLGIVLFGLCAFGLYVVPVLTVSYSFRYGIPPETFLVVSGILGLASLWPNAMLTANVQEEAASRSDHDDLDLSNSFTA